MRDLNTNSHHDFHPKIKNRTLNETEPNYFLYDIYIYLNRLHKLYKVNYPLFYIIRGMNTRCHNSTYGMIPNNSFQE